MSLEPLDYQTLNPGIQTLVRLLREAGFSTIDSGDGVTHECECDRAYPYVVLEVPPFDLVAATRSAWTFVENLGVELKQAASMEEAETLPYVGGYYYPQEDLAQIEICNITDSMLKLEA